MMVRKGLKRMAINTPLQGTAADMIKIAMVSVWKEIKDDKEIKTRLNAVSEKWGIRVSLTSSRQIYYWDHNNVQRFVN